MVGSNQAILAGGIFLGAYALIATDRLHRTVVALAGAALVLLLRVVDQSTAFAAVDWNTVFLLLGMMVIVAVTRRTGVFQWLAIKSAKAARAEPMRMILLFSAVTAVLSAFLDNVTTVLLIAPVTILIAEALSISPLPFLISEILASNIGGTATLVGDPPNIMIGSAAGLGFLSFVLNLAPVAAIIFIAYAATVRYLFRSGMTVTEEARARIYEFDESKAITDWPLLRRCLFVLSLTIIGFFLHEVVHLLPATVALAGAALLLVMSGADLEEVLHDVEWPTLLFFIGLFIMVAGLIDTGIITAITRWLLALAERSIAVTAIVLLWVSAGLSGVVDNIPFVATVNPMLLELAPGLAPPGANIAEVVRGPQMMPLWWSLALGACLGGNATLVGASANVVVAGIAERNGHPIKFTEFLKYGIPVVLESLVISTAYVYLRYL
ncbi:MAG: ArsB/NhaD family transporter [Armatimonadota bacterium]|nr:MAG: ArsB/NhaD family transporter [Armatimonadota bacterium]